MGKSNFNEKYSAYLADGHSGLALHNATVIDYLNKRFEVLTAIPDFKYYAIKVKKGFVEFVCDGLTEEQVSDEERRIQDVLDKSYNIYY